MFPNYLEARKALEKGNVTCKDLVGFYIKNIESQKNLNAVLEYWPEEAMSRAQEVDEKLKNGKAGKLAGMVIGIKDLISFKDHSLSASSHILEGFKAIYNSTVTERLLAEDAIIISRLNCDEFAMGASNESSYFGPVLNAKDHTRVSGGSSGGSAVAVQADLCMVSLGTDTGGSIRQPAAFCGIYGLKPTYSRVSRYGIIAYASSFDQVGPLAKDPADLALVMSVIAGKDPKDATSSSQTVPNYLKEAEKFNDFKIATLPEVMESEGLQDEIKQESENVLQFLKKEGSTFSNASFPYLDYAVPTYYMLTTAEASSNLSRYDGVHYGYRSKNAHDLTSTYFDSRSEGFGTEVKRRIMLGTFVLSAGYYDAYYAKAQKVRRLIKESLESILESSDLIMLPTTPTTAFKMGEKTKDPITMYLADIFTVQAALAGMPAISIPIGEDKDGMPIGIQFIAKKFEEDKLIAIAQKLKGFYQIAKG